MRMIFLNISKEQGLFREEWSEGSSTANPRTDEQKSGIRPRVWVSVPRNAKPTEGRLKVNSAVTGRKFTCLPGEISEASGWGNPSAPLVAMLRGSSEKSAEGIVAGWHS